MPAILNASIKTPGDTAITLTTLDGTTDTFTASQINSQSLLVVNPTVSPVTFTMIGDKAPATVRCDNIGEVAVTAESVTVPASGLVSVYLADLRTKLSGETSISGGAGLEAVIVTY